MEGLYLFLYVILLILLIFLTIWAINSYRLKRTKQKTTFFEKSRTEYLNPPRPHSESFNDFFRLSSSFYIRQQKKIAFLLSQLIKDYMGLSDHTTISSERRNLSENLELLLSDPDKWFDLQLNLIGRSDRTQRKGLSKRYIQILDEVQQLLGITLISEME
ncbi:MAG: hypothetical protein ACFFDT_27245 [Candidatus Hodarchaeota archaeon]